MVESINAGNSFNVNPIGSYVLKKLTLTSHSNTEIDLSDKFVEFNIYESLFSSVIFGDILVNESYNFVSYAPLLGGEELLLEVCNVPTEVSGVEITRKSVYVIYAIENRVLVKDRQHQYILRFCSKELIQNQQIRISTTIFNKTFTSIVLDVYNALIEEENKLVRKNKLSFLKQLKCCSRKAEQEEEKLTVHFPNLHPFECLHYLAGRAHIKKSTYTSNTKDSPKPYGNPFFFFVQFNNQFVFMSWSQLNEEYNYSKKLKEEIPNKDLSIQIDELNRTLPEKEIVNKPLFTSIPNIWKGTQNNDVGDFRWFKSLENFYTVEDHIFTKDFDFYESIKKGMFASRLIAYNTCKKKIVEHKWSHKHLYDKAKHLYDSIKKSLNVFNDKDTPVNLDTGVPGTAKSEYFSPVKYDSYVKVAPIHSDLFLTGKTDFCPELTKNQRILKLQELNNNILTVNIPGDLNFTAGHFSDLYIHSHELSSGEELTRDCHSAGTYINLRVRHTFKPLNVFRTTLEIAKDSFIENTLQTLPPAKKRGT